MPGTEAIVERSGGMSCVSRVLPARPLRFHCCREGRMRRSTRRVHAGNGGGSWCGRAGRPPFRVARRGGGTYPLRFCRSHEGRMRRATHRVHTGNGGGSWGGRVGRPSFRVARRRGGTYPLRFCCRQERRMRLPPRRLPVGNGGDRGAVGRDVLCFVWAGGVAVWSSSVSGAVGRGGCDGRRAARTRETEGVSGVRWRDASVTDERNARQGRVTGTSLRTP